MGYGVGFIGLGIMGRRMLGMIERHPGFSAVAAYDPRAEDLPIPREPNIEALLARTDLDAIYVASPPEAHLDAIRAVAARRLPPAMRISVRLLVVMTPPGSGRESSALGISALYGNALPRVKSSAHKNGAMVSERVRLTPGF